MGNLIYYPSAIKDPSQLGANFWMDFRDTTTMTLSGTNVNTITDKIGSQVFTFGGSNPVYNSALDSGRGAVTFTASNYFQANTSGSYWNIWYTLNALYLFMRVHYTAASGNFLYNIQGANGGFVFYISPDGFSQFRTNFTDWFLGTPNPTFTGFRNIRITAQPNASHTPTNNRFIVDLDNGTQVIRPSTATTGSVATGNVTTAPRIGGFAGHCAEFFTLPSTASAQDLTDAYAWLSR